MAAKGASLQTYNSELVKCEPVALRDAARVRLDSSRQPPTRPFSTPTGIEDLREKREEVNRQILRAEEDKAKIQKVRGRLARQRRRTVVTSHGAKDVPPTLQARPAWHQTG